MLMTSKKKYGSGITEKRLANRRFRKTEEAILSVFLSKDIYIGVNEMASKVGVARSTIYHHHRTIREIVPDYEKYILKKFSRVVRKKLKTIGVREIMMGMLIFIVQNKKIFRLLFKSGDERILNELMMKMKPKIVNKMRLPKNCDKMYSVYTGEIMAIIKKWGADGFSETEMGGVLGDIMNLTETMRNRLSFLLK